jgi:TPR repeat protein
MRFERYARPASLVSVRLSRDSYRNLSAKADPSIATGKLFVLAALALVSALLVVDATAQSTVTELQALADTGNAEAQESLAALYWTGTNGVPQDNEKAAAWYRKAADQGRPTSQVSLGIMYQLGEGVPLDYAQAAAWYRKAADQGSEIAEFNLGKVYASGQGLPQDYTRAAVWIGKAADQGFADAQFVLGLDYSEGHGLPKDEVRAAYWYRKAADQGHARAQDDLGISYELGVGVPQDYAQAAVWYRKGAEQGYAGAQFGLGSLYLAGKGVPRDNKEAYFWLDLAASGNLDAGTLKVAIRNRNEAASNLSAGALSKVQQRASEWSAAHPIPK